MDKKFDKPKKRLAALARKWLNKDLSAQEEQEFNAWYNSFSDADVREYTEEELDAIGEKLYDRMQSIRHPHHQSSKKTYLKYAMVAAVLLAVSIGAWLYVQEEQVPVLEATPLALSEVKPGTGQAVLELENGESLTLGTLGQGSVYQSNGVEVEKLGADELVFHAQKNKAELIPRQNVLRTPAGGTYKITLSDGTAVWLNAESRLSFPEAFLGDTREVRLEGEAYFQVARDENRPFIVQAADQEIRVLGTQFNVLAYADEPQQQTTLISGKVEVAHQGKRYTLKPGEQARTQGSDFTLKEVNTSAYTGWKEDLFVFEQASLQTILRRFARWYSIDIAYEVQRKDDRFMGSISRRANLQEALEILEAGGLKFRLERPQGQDRPVLVVEK